MAGIYIHIPFCRSRCIYCGFYSTTALQLRQEYVEAVCRELEKRAFEEGGRAFEEGGRVFEEGERVSEEGGRRKEKGEYLINTIYIGGGTPSQMTIGQLRQILDAVYIYNNVAEDAEVTIEVNPDDVTEDFVRGLSTLPVNRVSMGAQTFDDERLRFLHRRHSASQVSEAVRLLRDAGIRNISVDLMYGFPKESLDDWQHDISSALALNVEHLSAYCLMVEEGTPLYNMYSRTQQESSSSSHDTSLTSEELERAMYETLTDRLEAAGYEHYEISNFARKGYRSRHNSSYWDGTPYIGIGAAAHSYDGNTRSWNVSDIRKYIDAMTEGKRLFESETIDDDTRYNDLVTVALRTREGLDLRALQPKYRDYAIKNARRFISDGLLQLSASDHLALTRKGLFVSDMIMSELIYI